MQQSVDSRRVAMFAIIGAVAVIMQLTASAQKTSDERDVLSVDDRRMDALRRSDADPLSQIYADDYTLVAGTGQVRSKADQITELRSGRLRYANIDSTERQIRMYGDVAIVLSRQRATILQDGKPITTGDERVTRVYKKFGSQWRVIATHATPIR
jgi:uncharacterized protein (TIGR02246 family)